MAALTDLHVTELGDGQPVVLVHGAFGTALGTFAEQRPLADGHRLLLVDRRGYGESPDGDELGWPADARDLSALLDELGAAHLVGHSTGAVACLLAAGERPDGVRSLVAIEPPAFGVAQGDVVADRLAAAWRAVAERAPELETEAFVHEWALALAYSRIDAKAWTEGFTAADWKAAEATRREPAPVDAPLPLEALAAAPFPTVLAPGAWPAELAGSRAWVGAGFAAACARIAEAVGGRLVTFDASTHNPQREEAPGLQPRAPGGLGAGP
ncbi:MAG: alpha/beta hydrolase [Actinomycetota bacterium]|nr:alpha/beta hydrolase [Actinomycetota bacterium]